MSLSAPALRRLNKELAQLQANAIEGVRITVDDGDVSNLLAWIEGPAQTPYEGGYFKIRFQFGSDFPNAPPKCWFVTKIFHPNVSEKGEICVNTLKKDWKKEFGIAHILTTIKCLLIYPNPESALHEEAGRLLLEQYEEYFRHAKLFTSIHARSRPAEFAPTSTSMLATTSTPQSFPSPSSTKSKLRSPSPSTTSVLQPTSNNGQKFVPMEIDDTENRGKKRTVGSVSAENDRGQEKEKVAKTASAAQKKKGLRRL